MLYICMQKPDEVTSIVERLFDPLHWGQLAVHLVYEGAIYLAFHKYWEITNIYTHGGVEYVPSTWLTTRMSQCQAALVLPTGLHAPKGVATHWSRL